MQERIIPVIMALIFSGLLLTGMRAHAQVEDEVENQDTLPDTTIIRQDTIELNDEALIGTRQAGNNPESNRVIIFNSRNNKKIPRKAALYAAAFPGLGQVYNGSYWKVPIVFGSFITLGYLTVYFDDRYQVFRDALIALENNVEDKNPLRDVRFGTNATSLRRGVDGFRRNRDFNYILIAGAYALQIMEAIVDAHLIEFDVSDELSLNMLPSAGQSFALASGSTFVPAMGITLTLVIK